MAVLRPGGSGGGGGGGSGWVIIEDMAGRLGAVVSNKVFEDPGNNTVLQSCDVSGLTLTITVRCSYPKVDIDGTIYTLTPAADGGHYEDAVDFTLSAAGNLVVEAQTPDNSVGAVDTVSVIEIAPPEILTLSFTGGYPGSQTELKAGDQFQLTGTTDIPADAIDIVNFGAGSAMTNALVIVSGTAFTITGTIADRGTSVQDLPARCRARHPTTGGFGSTRDTNELAGTTDGVDLVKVNNLFPSVSIGTITYPPTQGAIKGSETATVVNVLSNFDTVVYDSPNGDLTVSSPAVSQDPKTVTRLSGSYNDSINNFRISATRAANDATTVDQGVVFVANVVPTVDITLPFSRLRSGGNNGTAAQDYAVTITANQRLLSAPNLLEDSGGNRGAFQGGGFTGGPSVWARDLRIDETIPDEKGTFAFGSLVAVGLSGLVQTTINSGAAYTLGGFVSRNLTFAAFATQTQLGTSVVDFAKLSAGIFTSTNQSALKQAIGTPPSVTNGYTVDATGINPTQVIWLDTAAAGANSGGTAQITNVEETV